MEFLYLPDIECASDYRWTNALQDSTGPVGQGPETTAKFRQGDESDAPWALQAEAFFHLTANISYPLIVFALHAFCWPAMIGRSTRAGSRCW